MLEIKNLTIRYKGRSKPAVSDLSLGVDRGEFVLLAGNSASGKSTAMQAVCGFIPDIIPAEISGEILLDGAAHKDPSRIAGIACMVQQDPETQFCTETVEEEVAFGPENLRFSSIDIEAAIERSLSSVKADHLRDRKLSTLSGGEKQKVAIASMLALEPEVLILDEPTANLDRRSVGQVVRAIDEMKRISDLTAIIVEHRVKDFIDMAGRVVVLEEGKLAVNSKRGQEEFQAIQEKASAPLPRRRPMKTCTDVVISVDRLSYDIDGSNILDDVSFDITTASVVALMGENGSGKTTLLRHLVGLQKVQQGRVAVSGHITTADRPADPWIIGKDVGIVFQNPNHQIFESTVEGEMLFASRNFGFPPGIAESHIAGFEEQEGLKRFVHPHCLSFGQKRRVNILSGSSHGPRVLLLDEPFAGQDVENANRIIAILERFQAEGGTIVMVTHDVDIAKGFCTDLVALSQGRVISSGPIDSVPDRCWRALSREGSH
jgi:energy-coupling factor transporter ATP-binding protein EcfA2